ncbi:MAG: BsaWI family type II restriction enzyme [Spirulina sp.]
MSYSMSKKEVKILSEIRRKYYMIPVLKKIDKYFEQLPSDRFPSVFNKLYELITSCQDEVIGLIEERKKRGEIKSVEQASRSVVGNIFPYCVIYIFIKNKEVENISSHIFITSKKSDVKGFEDISIVKIGEEDTQKPDCDLIIYSYQSNSKSEQLDRCIILSLKTSMRERAAQTYKWKLLLEIANDPDCNIKQKYNISYNVDKIPLICFVTVNFYNEINNPQQRGMLKFFDRSFLAKELETPLDFISPLSDLIQFVNEQLSE